MRKGGEIPKVRQPLLNVKGRSTVFLCSRTRTVERYWTRGGHGRVQTKIQRSRVKKERKRRHWRYSLHGIDKWPVGWITIFHCNTSNCFLRKLKHKFAETYNRYLNRQMKSGSRSCPHTKDAKLFLDRRGKQCVWERLKVSLYTFHAFKKRLR